MRSLFSKSPKCHRRAIGLAVAILSLCSIVRSANAHPFHVSVGEMQYDAESKQLEIAIRIWPLDLERSIKKKLDVEIDLDSTDETIKSETDKAIAKYLNSAFQVEDKSGDEVDVELVGRELEGTHVWIYVQIPIESEKNLDGLKFTNKFCFEALRDQTNTIKYKNGEESQVLQFTKDEPTAVLRTNDQ